MKKIYLTIALLSMLGIASFARGGYMGGGSQRGGCGGYGSGGYHHDNNGFLAANPDIENLRTNIMEKNLEIRKELLKNNPDWKKIEKLNTEIATTQAKIKTAAEK